MCDDEIKMVQNMMTMLYKISNAKKDSCERYGLITKLFDYVAKYEVLINRSPTLKKIVTEKINELWSESNALILTKPETLKFIHKNTDLLMVIFV